MHAAHYSLILLTVAVQGLRLSQLGLSLPSYAGSFPLENRKVYDWDILHAKYKAMVPL